MTDRHGGANGMARSALATAVVEAVRELHAAGHSMNSIPARCAERGLTVSRLSVRRILGDPHARQPVQRESFGEERLTKPQRCAVCRQPIVVKPCRVCRARWTLSRLRTIVQQIAGRRQWLPDRPGERPFARDAESGRQLQLDLEPEDAGRLAEVHEARRGLRRLRAG
jgi:hypothetical protein